MPDSLPMPHIHEPSPSLWIILLAVGVLVSVAAAAFSYVNWLRSQPPRRPGANAARPAARTHGPTGVSGDIDRDGDEDPDGFHGRRVRELEDELRRRTAELEAMVEERTAALESIRDETRQLALVASHTDNAVIITDRDGRISFVNESFERITEFTAAEAIGQRPGALLQGPDTDPETVGLIRDALRRREPVQTEILNYTKSGRPYWLAIEIQPVLDADGDLTHFMAIESDITATKEAAARLQLAKEEAESANEAKSQFLANMSHEIRTPLTGVIGFAEMLEQNIEADSETRRDWAGTIRSSARHLQSLLNDVLDVSKIEAGRMELEMQPVNLHGALSEIASIFRVSAGDKGLGLEVTCPNPLPQTITTDPMRLRQVLSNLVSNAIKFTPTGTVRIEADVVPVADGAPDPDGERSHIRIDVVDSGIGVPEDRQASIFEPFTQADSSVSREFGGTGLGLVISRQLCRALGGDLTLQSRSGFGSRFTATIDPGDIRQTLRVTSGEAQVASVPTAAEPEADRPIDARVLVADDGATNRKFITAVLDRVGCEVVTVVNGREAVNRVAHASPPFDAIIMDMQMPVLDGYAATQELRAAGIDCPILALTASALKGDRERCLAAGCTDYLTKPIDPDALIAAVRRAAGTGKGAVPADHVADDGGIRSHAAPVASPAGTPTAAPAAGAPMVATPPAVDSRAVAEPRAAAAAAAAPTKVDAPAINLPMALARCMNDPELLRATLECFLEEGPGYVQSFAADVDATRIEGVRRAAHALRGAAGTITAMDLQAAAERAELAAVDANLLATREAVDHLQRELDRCLTFVRTRLSNPASLAAAAPGGLETS